MKLIALGTNGWMPTNGQKTSSFLIEYKGYLIILDCGSGLSNLFRYEDILKKYSHVHIILTHYHLDHIIGISYLNNFFPDYNIHLYGPGEPYYSSVTEKLADFTSEDFFSRSALNMGKSLTVTNYGLEGFDIGEIKLTVNIQDHSSHSFAITIDDKLHYATDTSIIEHNFQLGSEVDLLLHECYDLGESSLGHSSLGEILEMKAKYGLDNIYLVHKNPNWSLEDLEAIRKELPVLKDGDILEF